MFDIQQSANRLQNAATSSERINALKQLQKLSKENCQDVGNIAMELILDLLKEHGDSDEYIEALELVSKLVKPKAGEAAKVNALKILEDAMKIELLLDLLEHEDGLVGVMASEILTNIHTIAGEDLEKTIQDCPAGMTKLLNRMPDRTREEVSNQAIILIRQLTSSNEEMKKTVAFNEGFETLFGIMESEGGCKEAGAVVQDCLQICTNVLDNSETCQRLFYGMGGGWHNRLLDFFSPMSVEQFSSRPESHGEGNEDEDMYGPVGPWYEQPGRLKCAILALEAFSASMSTSNAYEKVLVNSVDEVTGACGHWVIRGGPAEMLLLCLRILEQLASASTPVFAQRMFDVLMRFVPSVAGVHLPFSGSTPLVFSWKLIPTDDRRMISLVNLLAEQYIFPSKAWWGHESSTRSDVREGTLVRRGDYMVGSEFWMGALKVLQRMLAADEATSGMVMQHVLAPPPPPSAMDGEMGLDMGMPVEAVQMDLGGVVFGVLLNSIERLVARAGGATAGAQILQSDVAAAIRAANVLSLVLLHGGLLASELCTAIYTFHLSSHRTALDPSAASLSAHAETGSPILPYLLSLCSRVVRVPGVGFTVAAAVLRLLTSAASGCERATCQMLDDPTNFFIVDLATRSSEGAGVPENMQVVCCLFLGACFDSFGPDTHNSTEGVGVDAESRLCRRSILTMIDSKIGLSRYSDILKRPLGKAPRSGSTVPALDSSTSPEELFFCESYRTFYISQVDSIRSAIFDFYSGSAPGEESAEGQVIKMQKETIAQLEHELERMRGGEVVSSTANESVSDDEISALKQRLAAMESELSAQTELNEMLEETCREKEETIESMSQSETALVQELEEIRSRAEAAEAELISSKDKYAAILKEKAGNGVHSQGQVIPEQINLKLQNLEAENEKLRLHMQSYEVGNGDSQELLASKDQEILKLKEKVVNLVEGKKSLAEEVDVLNRKLMLLEEDLRTPMPHEKVSSAKVSELEARNANLKTQIWELESNISTMRSAMTSEYDELRESVELLVSLSEIETNDYFSGPHDRGGDTLPRKLSGMLQYCVDALAYASGHCSDMSEGVGVSFKGDESKGLQRLMEAVGQLCEQVREYEAEINEEQSFRSKLEAVESEVEALQDLNDAAQQRIEELEAEKIRTTDVPKISMSDDILRLQELLEQRDEKIMQLESALESATSGDADHVAALEQEVKLLLEKLSVESERNESLHSETLSLNNTIDSLNADLKKALDELHMRPAPSSPSLEEFTSLQADLNAAVDANGVLSSEIEAYREKIRRVDEELADAVRQLEEKSHACKVLEEAVESFRDAEEQKNQSNSGASSTVAAENAVLAEQIRELEATLLSKSQTIEKLGAELDVKSEEYIDISKTLDSYKESIANCKADTASLEDKVHELTAEMIILAENKKGLEDQLRMKTDENSTLKDTVQSLADQIDILKSDQLSLNDEIRRLQDLIKSKDEDIDALKSQEKLTEQIQSSAALVERELTNLKEELSAAYSNNESLTMELQSCKEKSSSLDAEIIEISRLLNEKTQAHDILLKECEEYREEIISSIALKESISRLETDKVQLMAEIEEMKVVAQKGENDREKVRKEVMSALEAEYADRLTSADEAAYLTREQLRKAELELESIKESNTSLQDQLNDARELAEGYESALQARDEDMEALKKSLEAKAIEHNRLLESFLSQKEKLAAATSGETFSTADKIRLESEKSDLMEKVATLKEQLSRCELQCQELIEDVNIKNGKISGYDLVIRNLEGEINGLVESKESTEDSYKASLQDLEEKLADTSAAYAKLQGDNANMQASMQEALQGYKVELEDCKSALKSLEQKEASLLRQVESFSKFSQDIRHYFHEVAGSLPDNVCCNLQQTVQESNTVESILRYVKDVSREVIEYYADKIQQQKVSLEVKENSIRECDKKIHELEQTLEKSKKSDSVTTVSKLTPSKNTPAGGGPVSDVVRIASPAALKDTARLHTELRKERQRLHALQEQHNDLLGLLAQQEVELRVFRSKLWSVGGSCACDDAEDEARRVAMERYGSYISFRNPGSSGDTI